MRTYDYILAMKENHQSMELDPFDDSDLSSDSDFDSPEKSTFVSRFICRGHRGNQVLVTWIILNFAKKRCSQISQTEWFIYFQNPTKLSIRIDKDPELSNLNKKQGFYVSINPWKLIKLSKEKALVAAEKARERLMKQKPMVQQDSLKPLPLETKCGPLTNPDMNITNVGSGSGSGSTPLISKGRTPGSPGRFSSPRRRFSGSPAMFSSVVPSPKQKYRSTFDLKLTEVSKELETYISRQVLCSVIKKDACEASPR